MQVRELGLKPADGAVVFGQIYGMAEQISVPLAMAGFTVYKSVPYGPLTEVSPVSTTIGPGPTRRGSHWSRASECCLGQQFYVIKYQLGHPRPLFGLLLACSLWHNTAGASNTLKLSTNES